MLINKDVELYTMVSASIFISGLLRLFVFYKFFDVDILPFIESSEVITRSFDAMLYFSLIFIYIMLIILFFYRQLWNERNKILDKKLVGRIKSYKILSGRKISFTLTFVGFIAYFNFVIRPNPDSLDLLLWILALVIATYIVPILFFEIDRILRQESVNFKTSNLVLIFSAVLLPLLTIAISANEVRKVKYNNHKIGSYIVIKNQNGTLDKIVSTEKYQLIGITKSYAFFNNRLSNQTDIFKVEDAVSISLK